MNTISDDARDNFVEGYRNNVQNNAWSNEIRGAHDNAQVRRVHRHACFAVALICSLILRTPRATSATPATTPSTAIMIKCKAMRPITTCMERTMWCRCVALVSDVTSRIAGLTRSSPCAAAQYSVESNVVIGDRDVVQYQSASNTVVGDKARRGGCAVRPFSCSLTSPPPSRTTFSSTWSITLYLGGALSAHVDVRARCALLTAT